MVGYNGLIGIPFVLVYLFTGASHSYSGWLHSGFEPGASLLLNLCSCTGLWLHEKPTCPYLHHGVCGLCSWGHYQSPQMGFSPVWLSGYRAALWSARARSYSCLLHILPLTYLLVCSFKIFLSYFWYQSSKGLTGLYPVTVLLCFPMFPSPPTGR